MLGKDKTVFALFKAYGIICNTLSCHGEEDKNLSTEGNQVILGEILVQDFILLNPHNFTCKVEESVVCTSKFCLNQ